MNIYNHNDVFIQNKYTKWYYNIIIKAQNSNRVKLKRTDPKYIYYENHHVLPNCIFPEYSKLSENKWNGVLLTDREHHICHALLVKMVNNRNNQIKLNHALMKMLSDKRNGRTYTKTKYLITIHDKFKGRTKEHTENISKARKGFGYYKNALGEPVYCKTDDPRVISKELVGRTAGIRTKGTNKGKVTAIEVSTGKRVSIPKELFDGILFVGVRKGMKPSEKCIEANRNRTYTAEQRERIGAFHRGKPKSEEWKEKNRKPKSKYTKRIIL